MHVTIPFAFLVLVPTLPAHMLVRMLILIPDADDMEFFLDGNSLESRPTDIWRLKARKRQEHPSQ